MDIVEMVQAMIDEAVEREEARRKKAEAEQLAAIKTRSGQGKVNKDIIK